MGRDKLVKAEIVAGEKNSPLRIVLAGGSVLVGQSWGIEPGTDGEKGEADFDVLAFFVPDLNTVTWLRNEQITDVSLA
ncbi:MAG: hypothetical protein Q4B15_03235 [Lachnospiraceae bacterium]|nr:hypothetical protein [Lachnospiraceae bacterium]